MELDRLKRKRAAFKSSTTKLSKRIDESKDSIDSSEIDDLLNLLQGKIYNIKILDDQIVDLIDVNDIEAEIERSEEYYEKLITNRCMLQRKINDLREFRTMYDKIETQIRNLESLSVDTKTYANLLTIIIKLLPSDLALDFTRKTVDENWSLDFLRKELLCKERAKLINSERNNRRENLNYNSENSSATELLANSQKPNYGSRRVINSKGSIAYGFNQSSPLKNTVMQGMKVSVYFIKKILEYEEIVIEALETKQLSSAQISIPAKEVREKFESLGLELADVPVVLDKGACEIGLLVGSDNYWKFVGNRIERLDESLVAVETIFGFCIHGSISEDKDNDETSVNLVVSKESTSHQLNQFWQLENLGIEVKEDIKDISENEIFKSFKSSIEYSGNRFKVGLLGNQK
ncbi:DUF1758 domain-containing protein [Trichonephila clavata]|uniref:DUF1758 domain-containing protein n=1 Tax=Trichonephila clavata TaxID=2740835 RepID=A0A8X6LRM2_TRICU|nr:DUF1758 domain-containing protein [Trichonephila clavata]